MRKLILDTDWWTDCDDCVALRYLCRALKPEDRLLGVNINTYMPYSVASVNAFLDVEEVFCSLGADTEATMYPGQGTYQRGMAEFPVSQRRLVRPVYPSVSFYRQLLSQEQDVEILSIGFLGGLYRLLCSQPDEWSPLTGEELVERSVSRLWVMGGRYDEQGGREYNFSAVPYAAMCAGYVLEHVRKETVLLGWELGKSVLSGQNLPKDDILGQALRDHGSGHGRWSWDPMLVMAALENDREEGSYVYQRSHLRLTAEGANYFEPSDNGRFYILAKRLADDGYYTDKINAVVGGRRK